MLKPKGKVAIPSKRVIKKKNPVEEVAREIASPPENEPDIESDGAENSDSASLEEEDKNLEEVVKQQRKETENVNAYYKDKTSAELHKMLMEGCEFGLAGEIERILANPAGAAMVNMATMLGDYALNRAIRCKQWGCVALLLEVDKININALDVNRDTPLLLAVKLCHMGGMEWIRPLLKKGADYTVRDAKGKRVLDVARDRLDFECLKVLLDNGVVGDLKGEVGSQWMFGASEAGNKKSIKILLDAGAPANAANKDGTTALIDTLKRKYRDCAELLITAGADVNSATRHNTLSSVQLAASAGMGGLIVTMLRRKLDPNSQFLLRQDNQVTAFTLLTWAVRHGSSQMVKLLIENGADVNATPETLVTRWQTALADPNSVTEGAIQAKLDQTRTSGPRSLNDLVPGAGGGRGGLGSMLKSKDKLRAYAQVIGKQQTEAVKIEAKLQEESRLSAQLASSPLTLDELPVDVDPYGLATGRMWVARKTKLKTIDEEHPDSITTPGILEPRSGLGPSLCGGLTAENCRSPLMWAVVIHTLKRGNDRPSHVEDERDAAVRISGAEQTSDEILNLLLACKTTDLCMTSVSGESAFSLCASFGVVPALSTLIHSSNARGIVPSVRCLVPALTGSCRFGHPEPLRLILAISKLRLPHDTLLEPLLKASVHGHTECLQIIFAKSRELGLTTARGQCIHAAATHNHTQSVAFLVQCPSSESEERTARDNGQALLAAVKKGNYSCVSTLLAHHTNVNSAKTKTNEKQKTALMIACREWGRKSTPAHLACVSLLVRHSADVNVPDSHDDVPLKWAAVQGNLAAIRLLVDAGANLSARDSENNTPVAVAALHGHGDCVQELIVASGAVDEKVLPATMHIKRRETTVSAEWQDILRDSMYRENQLQGPLLIVAIANGWLGATEALLDNNCDVNINSENKHSPLLLAAGLGWVEVVERMLQRGADVNFIWQGCTPLTWAVHNKQNTVISLLLRHGAKQIPVALLGSCIRQNVEAVKCVMAHDMEGSRLALGAALVFAASATPTDEFESEESPTAVDLDSDRLSTVAYLLAHIEDVNAAVSANKELSEWCTPSAFKKMFPEQLAMKHLQVASTALVAAAASGNVRNMHRLLTHGADPRIADALGRTPLCWASYRGSENAVKVLIVNGAVIDEHIADVRRVNRFFRAREIWRKVLIKAKNDHFLNKSAPDFRFQTVCAVPDIEDNIERVTPLLCAAINGHVGVCRILAEAGADVDEALQWAGSIAATAYSTPLSSLPLSPTSPSQSSTVVDESVLRARETLAESLDTVTYGPYVTCSPLLITPEEILEGVVPRPIPPHKRLKCVQAHLSVSGWSLVGIQLLCDAGEDVALAAACGASGSIKALPGGKGSVRIIYTMIEPQEFIHTVEWVTGEDYLLAIRFTTNFDRHIGWFGEPSGNAQSYVVHTTSLKPSGREICGLFGKEKNNRIVAIGFISRIRHADHIYRQYRGDSLTHESEWRVTEENTAANMLIKHSRTLKENMNSALDAISAQKGKKIEIKNITPRVSRKLSGSVTPLPHPHTPRPEVNVFAVLSTFAPIKPKAAAPPPGISSTNSADSASLRSPHPGLHVPYHNDAHHDHHHDTEALIIPEDLPPPSHSLTLNGPDNENARIASVRLPRVVKHQVNAVFPTVRSLQKKKDPVSNKQLQAFLETSCGHKHESDHHHGDTHGENKEAKHALIDHLDAPDNMSSGIGSSLEIEEEVETRPRFSGRRESVANRRMSTAGLNTQFRPRRRMSETFGSSVFSRLNNSSTLSPQSAAVSPMRVPLPHDVSHRVGLVYAVKEPGPTLSKVFASDAPHSMLEDHSPSPHHRRKSIIEKRRASITRHETTSEFSSPDSRQSPAVNLDHTLTIAQDEVRRHAAQYEELATEIQGVNMIADLMASGRHGAVNQLKKQLLSGAIDETAKIQIKSHLEKLGHLQGDRKAKLQTKVKRHERKLKALIALSRDTSHNRAGKGGTPTSKQDSESEWANSTITSTNTTSATKKRVSSASSVSQSRPYSANRVLSPPRPLSAPIL